MKPQPFHIKSRLKNNKEMRTFQHNQKKYYLCFNEKLEIASYKGDNFFNERSELINKCRSQFKLTLLRHDSWNKSNIFTETFLAIFPLKQPFWSARLMFYILWFLKQKSSSLTQQFHWRILWVICSVNTAWHRRHPFVWILLHCNFYVIRYYLFYLYVNQLVDARWRRPVTHL